MNMNALSKTHHSGMHPPGVRRAVADAVAEVSVEPEAISVGLSEMATLLQAAVTGDSTNHTRAITPAAERTLDVLLIREITMDSGKTLKPRNILVSAILTPFILATSLDSHYCNTKERPHSVYQKCTKYQIFLKILLIIWTSLTPFSSIQVLLHTYL